MLDSSCFFHKCPNLNILESYQACNEGKVLMGNIKACKVIGIGNVKIRMFNGMIRELHQVKL